MGTDITIPKTLRDAIIQYSDPNACVELIVALRWPDGVVCPHCQSKNCKYMDSVQRYKCYGCRKQFSVKVGTVLEDSPISLTKWIPAFWLLTSAKNGISSCELARALGVTQKTAWFMLHRIRHILQTGTFEKMSGTVEADETFIGGKAKNMHKAKREAKIQGRGSVGKAVVMGILERGETFIDENGEIQKTTSKVKAVVIPNTTKDVLQSEIKSTVQEGSEVFTDAARGYTGLEEDYSHEFVDHAVKFVEGRVHTNSLENFWSLLKRSLKGTYVAVEPEHLMAYIGEQVFRFNERKTDDRGRFVKAMGNTDGRLTYEELTGKA